MTKPCVLDIKLGSQAYNPKKLARQQWKAENSTSTVHGFRICGMSYYEPGDSELTLINKYSCRAFQTETMRDKLGKFFEQPFLIDQTIS